jgi:hypothetical protein
MSEFTLEKDIWTDADFARDVLPRHRCLVDAQRPGSP